MISLPEHRNVCIEVHRSKMDRLDEIIDRCMRETLNERIKTREEYAESDKKEARKLFRSLIGIFNRCNDKKAEGIVEKLNKLAADSEKVDFSSFKRRYNYTTAQRRKEDEEKWEDGYQSALKDKEENNF